MKGLPTNFNWVEYLNLNPDVKRVFKTEQGAINHYLKYGRFENRKYYLEVQILKDEITDEKELIQNNVNDVTVILENIETETITPVEIDEKELIQNNVNDVTVILENIETETITPVEIDDNVEIKVIKKKEEEEINKPTVSIIVPVYNVCEYIEESLDSIYSQTYFIDNNFEVLVGVDGCELTLNKLKTISHKYKNLKIYKVERKTH